MWIDKLLILIRLTVKALYSDLLRIYILISRMIFKNNAIKHNWKSPKDNYNWIFKIVS